MYTNREEIRKSGVYRNHPQHFNSLMPTIFTPFDNDDIEFEYRAIQYNALRIAKEMKKNPEKGPAPPGFDESASILKVPNLTTLLDEALKDSSFSPLDESIEKVQLYSYRKTVAGGTAKGYACSPEPQVLLISGNLDLLKSMIYSHLGKRESLLENEYFMEIIENTDESQWWAMQIFKMMSDAKNKLARAKGTSDARIERMNMLRKRRPEMSIKKRYYLDTEIRSVTEYVFADEKAAKAFQERLEQSSAVPALDDPSDKTPQEVKDHINKRAQKTKVKVDGNRIIRESVRTEKDIREMVLLRNKYKEYYENLNKEDIDSKTKERKTKKQNE